MDSFERDIPNLDAASVEFDTTALHNWDIGDVSIHAKTDLGPEPGFAPGSFGRRPGSPGPFDRLLTDVVTGRDGSERLLALFQRFQSGRGELIQPSRRRSHTLGAGLTWTDRT